MRLLPHVLALALPLASTAHEPAPIWPPGLRRIYDPARPLPLVDAVQVWRVGEALPLLCRGYLGWGLEYREALAHVRRLARAEDVVLVEHLVSRAPPDCRAEALQALELVRARR